MEATVNVWKKKKKKVTTIQKNEPVSGHKHRVDNVKHAHNKSTDCTESVHRGSNGPKREMEGGKG